MKFSASLSVAIFSTAVLSSAVVPSRVSRDAPSFIERDLATVTGVLNKVGGGIDDLDTVVKAYDGGDSGPVVDSAKSLVSTINAGKTTVDGSDDLTLEDALGLQEPVKALTNQASTLVDDLKSKLDTIAKAGECETTRGLIGSIDTSSNSLIDSVIAKVPEAAQTIAEGLAADLVAVLKDAKDSFSESNCVDAEGSEPTTKPTSKATAEPTSTKATAEPTGETTAEPTGETTAEPTAEPTTEATAEPTVTSTPTGVIPPPPSNGTETTTGVVPVPTAGAGTLIPAGALAIGFAVALL